SVFRCSKTSRTPTEHADGQLVIDPRRSRLHSMDAVVAHLCTPYMPLTHTPLYPFPNLGASGSMILGVTKPTPNYTMSQPGPSRWKAPPYHGAHPKRSGASTPKWYYFVG